MLIPINSFGADSDSILSQFGGIYSKFSRLASTSIATMSVDSSGKILASFKKKIPGIEILLRINSAGIIINEIASTGLSVPMRSIGTQAWFERIQETKKPYCGINREPGGRSVLFWAWPIITGSGNFGGILATKVNPAEIIDPFSQGDSISICLSYNDHIVYCTADRKQTVVSKSARTLMDSAQFVIVCSKDVNNYIDSADVLPSVQSPLPATKTVEELQKQDESTVSSTAVTSSDSKKGNGILIWLLVGVVVSAAWFFARKLKNAKNGSVNDPYITGPRSIKNEVTAVSMDTVEDSPQLTDRNGCSDITDDKNNLGEHPIVTKEIISNGQSGNLDAEETCKKIKSFVFGNQDLNFQNAASSTDGFSSPDTLRKELYREIHGEITEWVTSESSRLSRCLEELSERVGQLENSNDPEVARIRNEARRISKEISSFKDNITNEEHYF